MEIATLRNIAHVGRIESPMKKLPLDTLLSILRDLRRDLRQPIDIRSPKMKLAKKQSPSIPAGH